MQVKSQTILIGAAIAVVGLYVYNQQKTKKVKAPAAAANTPVKKKKKKKKGIGRFFKGIAKSVVGVAAPGLKGIALDTSLTAPAQMQAFSLPQLSSTYTPYGGFQPG